MNTRPPRCGYAMLLVLVFIALVLSIFGVSYRYMATALRVETARTLQQRRDEGSVHALALGLALLETGPPPSESYACSVEISTSEGPRSFTVTFTLEKEDIWSVYARPTSPIEDLPLMPDSFADPDSPPGRPDKPPRDKPQKPPRGKQQEPPRGKQQEPSRGKQQTPEKPPSRAVSQPRRKT